MNDYEWLGLLLLELLLARIAIITVSNLGAAITRSANEWFGPKYYVLRSCCFCAKSTKVKYESFEDI